MIYPPPQGVTKLCVLQSMRKTSTTNMVTYFLESGKFSCDCKYYSIHSICSHTVACAEINDALNAFLKWHSQNNKRTNKHKQATQNLNLMCVGQKGHLPRRRRSSQVKDPNFQVSNSNNISFHQCNQLPNHETQFILKQLHGTQIRKCYGCRLEIRTPPSVPPHHFDISSRVNCRFLRRFSITVA